MWMWIWIFIAKLLQSEHIFYVCMFVCMSTDCWCWCRCFGSCVFPVQTLAFIFVWFFSFHLSVSASLLRFCAHSFVLLSMSIEWSIHLLQLLRLRYNKSYYSRQHFDSSGCVCVCQCMHACVHCICMCQQKLVMLMLTCYRRQSVFAA